MAPLKSHKHEKRYAPSLHFFLWVKISFSDVSSMVISCRLESCHMDIHSQACLWKDRIELPWLLQFSHSVMSDSSRPPCQSPTPRVYSDSCPSSWWCCPAISSSVIPFSSCLQFLPASESFPMSQPFTWGGQSNGVSASISLLPMNTKTDLL